jgi:hypothetical protein
MLRPTGAEQLLAPGEMGIAAGAIALAEGIGKSSQDFGLRL